MVVFRKPKVASLMIPMALNWHQSGISLRPCSRREGVIARGCPKELRIREPSESRRWPKEGTSRGESGASLWEWERMEPTDCLEPTDRLEPTDCLLICRDGTVSVAERTARAGRWELSELGVTAKSPGKWPDCEGAGSDGIRKIGLFTPLSVLAARARGGGGGAGSLPGSTGSSCGEGASGEHFSGVRGASPGSDKHVTVGPDPLGSLVDCAECADG